MKIKKIIPMVAFASISLSAMAQGQTLSSGIDLKNMDNSVRPNLLYCRLNPKTIRLSHDG